MHQEYALINYVFFLSATQSYSKAQSYSWLGSACTQTGKQSGIPPLRTVVTYRDAQRLLLTYQHQQPLAPRDSRIDQVTLQQHVVLRGQWNHNGREFRTLRLVNRDRVG